MKIQATNNQTNFGQIYQFAKPGTGRTIPCEVYRAISKKNILSWEKALHSPCILAGDGSYLLTGRERNKFGRLKRKQLDAKIQRYKAKVKLESYFSNSAYNKLLRANRKLDKATVKLQRIWKHLLAYNNIIPLNTMEDLRKVPGLSQDINLNIAV